ncbi:hypothetical protein D7V77_43000, partial [Corallococcus sp. CA041A]
MSLGDRINKGSFNLRTQCFFFDLAEQAERAGGRVVLQWGNQEVQTAKAWDNSKTRGPGGMLWELWAYGIEPSQFFAASSSYGKALRHAPVVSQLGEEILLVHGGLCPSERSLAEELRSMQQ